MEIKTKQCWRLLLSFKKYEFCVGNAGEFCRTFVLWILLWRLGLLYLRATLAPDISSVWQGLGRLQASGYQASSWVWVHYSSSQTLGREINRIFPPSGHLLPHLSRVELCAGLHGQWGLHHAGVSQTEVWRSEDPSLPLRTGNSALRLHQDISRSHFDSTLNTQHNVCRLTCTPGPYLSPSPLGLKATAPSTSPSSSCSPSPASSLSPGGSRRSSGLTSSR